MKVLQRVFLIHSSGTVTPSGNAAFRVLRDVVPPRCLAAKGGRTPAEISQKRKLAPNTWKSQPQTEIDPYPGVDLSLASEEVKSHKLYPTLPSFTVLCIDKCLRDHFGIATTFESPRGQKSDGFAGWGRNHPRLAVAHWRTRGTADRGGQLATRD